jgi:hypothetical protein
MGDWLTHNWDIYSQLIKLIPVSLGDGLTQYGSVHTQLLKLAVHKQENTNWITETSTYIELWDIMSGFVANKVCIVMKFSMLILRALPYSTESDMIGWW